MRRFVIFLSLVFVANLVLAANDYEVRFKQTEAMAYQLSMQLHHFSFAQEQHNGTDYTVIHFGVSTVTEKKGFAQLPLLSTAVQLPVRKNVDLVIKEAHYEEYPLDHPLLPSRGVIYRDQDPSQIPYEIDPESLTDTWYPGELAVTSAPFIIRDVRGTSVQFYPFQYNAQQNRLRVYQSITVELIPNDQAPENPLTTDPWTILRELDGLYHSVFINYEPESESATRDPLPIRQYGEILVIYTDRDTEAIEPYIRWKREKGYQVHRELVATGTNPKDLIQQKYDENNQILYVQLVGDWEDIPCDLGTSSNKPMDPKLGCVVGDDPYPDISIGRFSANSAEELSVQVNKAINYEKYPQTAAAWYRTATGIASNEGPGDDGEYDYQHLDVIWNDKLHPFTYENYHDIYDPSATKSMVFDAVNEGTSIINYTGHGSATSWSTTSFSNSDVDNLSNADRLPWIVSVACNNGEFNRSTDCFAEAWLKKDGGGAVGMLASSISQPWNPPMRGQDYFMDLLIGGYDYDAHSGQYGINTSEQRSTIGSIVVNGFSLMLTESSGNSDIETVHTWGIFGDAALQVRSREPLALMLSNETVMAGVAYSTTVSAGDPVEGAMVTLSQDDQYFSGITDADGQATIEHNLDPGPALLVVSAFNTQTIYETIEVVAADGPYIVIESHTIEDTESGNGNHQADYGELTYLNLAAQNIGNEPAFGVEAILSSDDIHITILDSMHVYGEMDTMVIVEGMEAFQIQFSDSVPDQHTINCSVRFSDDSSNTWLSNLSIIVNAPLLETGEWAIDDSFMGNDDGKLDAGETADWSIITINAGHAASGVIHATLESGSDYVIVQTSSFSGESLLPGDSVLAIFTISADPETPAGTIAPLYYRVTSGAYQHLDTIQLVIGEVPVYLMSNTTVHTNHALFYDSGGPENPYQSRERLTMTFYPEGNGSPLQVVFSAFDVESNDALTIYDGPNSSAAQVAGSPFSGNNVPGTITASNAEGALTFYFSSNLLFNSEGWEAEIISTVVSDLDDQTREPVQTFELFPNYPNPFNPVTTIRYQVPNETMVRITIYNLLGQEIRTLIHESKPPGMHQVQWDGHNEGGKSMASGVYWLQMEAAQFRKELKLLLLK
jgi:hypothetical protein